MKHTNDVLIWMQSKVRGERDFIQVTQDMVE